MTGKGSITVGDKASLKVYRKRLVIYILFVKDPDLSQYFYIKTNYKFGALFLVLFNLD
jgi:hypothetical protein